MMRIGTAQGNGASRRSQKSQLNRLDRTVTDRLADASA